jgi:hypothetical protein
MQAQAPMIQELLVDNLRDFRQPVASSPFSAKIVEEYLYIIRFIAMRSQVGGWVG